MKITKNYLTKVIKEEVQKVLKEQREDMTPRTKLYLRDLTVGAYKNAGVAGARAGDAYDPKTGIVTMPEKYRTPSFMEKLNRDSILKKLDPKYPDGVYMQYYLQDRLAEILEDLQAEGFFTGDEDTIHTINLNF